MYVCINVYVCLCVSKRERVSDWREFHMFQSILFLSVIKANDQYLVKANVMFFSEIDEGKDVTGQRGTSIDRIFYLITSEWIGPAPEMIH